MGNDTRFDPDQALKDYFKIERLEEDRIAKPTPDQCAKPRQPAHEWRLPATILRFAALVACMTLVFLYPSRSPLIELGGKAFEESARNGTFQTLSDNAVAALRAAGQRFVKE